MKSFDSVSGRKQLRVTVKMPHGHPPGWAPVEIGLFIDHHLQGGEALPEIGELQVEKGQVRLKSLSRLKLKQAALHFTTDTAAINRRTWQSLPAQIEGDLVTVAAPTPDTTAWFLTVTDERDAVVSSRVVLSSK